VTENYIVLDSDVIIHSIGKIETPILNIVPKIIYEDDDLVVVSKPPD